MMDWERFYEEADYDRCAYLGGEAMVDLAERFFERVGVPDDFASVGCGPAVCPFALADRYPDAEFVGLDLSPTVVADNRERAAERGLENLDFAVDSLPSLDVDRRFDVVYCVATLYFVVDAERAVAELYDRVREGGHLVLNYPNRYSRARFDREFEGRKREAFELVLEGENLLSYEAIRAATGGRPRSYWRLVDAEDREFADRARPCVVVEK
ncbi:class I SAM-dependent methyltransferase [halophilic archaeon]|nr:class I SAM-dependent methyltransferase [halophilic archaeon]